MFALFVFFWFWMCVFTWLSSIMFGLLCVSYYFVCSLLDVIMLSSLRWFVVVLVVKLFCFIVLCLFYVLMVRVGCPTVYDLLVLFLLLYVNAMFVFVLFDLILCVWMCALSLKKTCLVCFVAFKMMCVVGGCVNFVFLVLTCRLLFNVFYHAVLVLCACFNNCGCRFFCCWLCSLFCVVFLLM